MGLSKKLQRLESYERAIFAINHALQQQVTDQVKIRAIQLVLVAEDLAYKTYQAPRPAIKESKNEQFDNIGPNNPTAIQEPTETRSESPKETE